MQPQPTPLVSVCVITYNHESFIRKCLEGIMMQQLAFPLEVVVGEDCSTDDTKRVVQEFEASYPAVIKPIYHARNVGGARNGYEFCYPRLTGKYIALCEGDDFWTDPLKLQRQVEFLERHPECVLCFHRVNRVDHADRFVHQARPAQGVTFYSGTEMLHIHIPTAAVMFRNCIESLPDEIFAAPSTATFLFGMLSRFGGAANLGFVGASYRRHPGGLFSQQALLEQYRHTIDTRRVMARCRWFTAAQKAELRKEVTRRKLSYAKRFIRDREVMNCWKILTA